MYLSARSYVELVSERKVIDCFTIPYVHLHFRPSF
jgi:hypothetical protein